MNNNEEQLPITKQGALSVMRNFDLRSVAQDVSELKAIKEKRQRERMIRAAGDISLQVVFAGTEMQLGQIHSQLQGLDKSLVAKVWIDKFNPLVDQVDLDALARENEVDGWFREQPSNAGSPILPRLLRESLRQNAEALEHRVQHAADYDTLASVYDQQIVEHSLKEPIADTAVAAGLVATFWDKDRTNPKTIILPIKQI